MRPWLSCPPAVCEPLSIEELERALQTWRKREDLEEARALEDANSLRLYPESRLAPRNGSLP